MTKIIRVGHPPIDVLVRQSSRARRMTLRVSGLDGRASLTVPKGVAEKDAELFLAEKQDWLSKHSSRKEELVPVEPGQTLPVEGHDRLIFETSAKSIRLMPDHLLVPTGRKNPGARVKAFLKTLAQDRILHDIEHYARLIEKPFGKVSLRDPRSRWGSCTSDGNLMLSWRLILAPRDVLRYVVAHEVCHLAEMNHSLRFWAKVEELMPEYKTPKTWLRKHGHELHKYQFPT